MATLIEMQPTEQSQSSPPSSSRCSIPQPGEVVVDCTFGAGGHARLVADRIGPTGAADLRSTATPRPRSAFDDARSPSSRASRAS